MQFYFAVATATFIALLAIPLHEQCTFDNTKEWGVYMLVIFMLSLCWPSILIGLIIETHYNIKRN